MRYYIVAETEWSQHLNRFLSEYELYAPVKNTETESYDYEQITAETIDSIYYNGNTPTTPLKTFYLPIKENVVNIKENQPRIVIGVPNCDLAALNILDNIYLDDDYIDPCYKQNRDNTVIFGKDCYTYKKSCHCTSYSLKPYPQENCDVSMSITDGMIYLCPMSDKGESLLKKHKITDNKSVDTIPETIISKRQDVVNNLQNQNKNLPDEKNTRISIEKSSEELWDKYSDKCVSCGACSFICPTCHCFLLIDKEHFEKVRSVDVCQYPGFARVAAGEDPLHYLNKRFKYRYLCKYCYKPDMFKALACTGCGRCIDACIGKIDKNELILESFK